ncbi:MAG: M20/M25/M40 family metallo-hydrolase [Phycisphaerae bacterium]|jgi:acetylornithine deacetylase/succinyl-diaminopimelate desuccinylase-like protein
MTEFDPAIVEFVRSAARSERYAAYLRDTLVKLIAVNTAPDANLDETAARERALFDLIADECRRALGESAVVERPAIDPAIASEPAYSQPGYAAGPDGAAPDAATVYAGRTNLHITVPGRQSPPAVILHAHADVVPPWFAPRVEGARVFGRGACDNKAQIALLLAQMRLLAELGERLGVAPARGRVYQFVIDEEIGGNGSLSAARDRRLAGVPVLIHECTDLVPYCAHRGAVWYRCKLSVGGSGAPSAVEIFPFVVLALEEEGRRIKEETRHPLFTADHVQTAHGILGPFGSAPAVVCDHVAVEIVAKSRANPQRVGMKVIEFFEEAVGLYTRLYGDKTREPDPTTGKPKVARHFDVRVTPSPDVTLLRIDVYGKSGHLASVSECDGAITKAAFLLAGLVKAAAKYPQVEAVGRFPGGNGPEREIILEGGQGFTPAHAMADVQRRLADAARRGAQKYCKHRNRPYDDAMIDMRFDRLHNDAYADSPDCAPMRALTAACRALGLPAPKPRGWEVSCDARLYHHKGHPTAIFGAGKLHLAHGDSEHVDIPDIQEALAVSSLATWSLVHPPVAGNAAP